MKKIYAFTICAAICVSSVSGAPNRFSQKRVAKKTSTAALVATPRESAKIWRPVSATEFVYDDGEWVSMGEALFTYDNRGNVITQSLGDYGVTRVITNTYNDDDMLTSRIETQCIEGKEPMNVSRRTYVYDPIVKNYYIERMGYDWSNDTWVENYYCEINEITRNSDGNIVEIVKKLPLFNDMTPAYKSVWHYNESTGQADEYAYYANMNLGDPQWQLYDGVSYKNITWENTDGQMTKDFQELIEGANRISRAEVYYEGELDGHIIITYSGEKDYTIKNTFTDPNVVGEEIVRKTIDDNGSYTRSAYLYIDEDDNITDEPFISETEYVTFDSYGNIVEVRVESIYGDEPAFLEIERYDYKYDDNGNPTELTISYYDEDEDEYINELRTVYGEYIDVTDGSAGIDNISIDNNSTGVEVYNLNGVRVADSTDGLATGLYIVRNGSSVTKVAVK